MKSVFQGMTYLILLSAASIAGAAEIRNGTEAEIAAIKKEMETQLKDADSAKIMNLRLVKEESGSFFCGLVNSKNSYGAYAGYEPFNGLKFDRPGGKDLYFVAGIGEAAGKVCKDHGL
ncbi:hypothetical protein ACVA51_13435 [Pseudomonas luteola]